MNIPFNKPYLTGKEAHYMYQAVYNGKLSGNGEFTKRCQRFFEEKYGFKKCLLTTSCTDALEMCAILCDIKPGDEVIVPSYTFVSSALAFVRAGAKIVFADKHNLLVVEDAAQAIDSYYKGRPLGTIGHLSAFSFHETKNIISGEGGMLGINDERFIRRAEIIWEKGTNRAEFFRGEVNKYGWVDTGSSFLTSEVVAAFLWAQLENMDDIQAKRKLLWNKYYELLEPESEKGAFVLPDVPDYATNNAHMFYLVCNNLEERTALIKNSKKTTYWRCFII